MKTYINRNSFSDILFELDLNVLLVKINLDNLI